MFLLLFFFSEAGVNLLLLMLLYCYLGRGQIHRFSGHGYESKTTE